MTTENPLLKMIREVCSLGRAELDRPHTPKGDGDAERALVAGLQARDPAGVASDISLSLDLLAPRAPYFDQLILDCIAAQIPQVVNLGAGYDDRALRFRSPGVTYFELDLPGMIADKRQRLAAMAHDTTDLRIAATDFARDDVADVLSDMGHDASQPTLFFAEHLALFLTPSDAARLIDGIAHRAAVGSKFALTAETHPAGLDSAEVVSTVDTVMFGGAGPLRTILSFSQWDAILDQAGWDLEDADRVVVEHFSFLLAGRTVPIQTRFITTAINPLRARAADHAIAHPGR